MRRILGVVSLAFVISVAFGVEPQTDTNVVASAGDAFGITLGPESLGLYSASSVRGFSPLTAGNVRLDGLYFDQQGGMIDPLVTDTRIRVGLSAINFSWPAPSGIVDYTLRQPKGDDAELTSILYVGPYNSRDVDLDGYKKSPDRAVGIAAGASYHSDAFTPGQTARTASFGVLPQWNPLENLSVRAFWGRANTTDIKPAEYVYVSSGQAAPSVPTRFFGTSWATSDDYVEHYGFLAKAKLGTHWTMRAGLFHSLYDGPRNYIDLYLNTTSNGIADHTLLGEPNQRYSSTSGEFQLANRIENKSWSQELIVGMRGRSVSVQYGGATTFDFGMSRLGQVPSIASTPFVFGSTSTDHIHDYSSETSYTFQWNKHLNFTAGLRHATYSNEHNDPVTGRFVTSTSPWLYNSSLALFPTSKAVVFGSLTRGLEDSGTAPFNSVNRGQVLNATRSSQEETGLKYSLTSSLTLLTAVFDIQKPYFALGPDGVFGDLGQVRHRGIEISMAGQLTSGLSLVAGILLMSPEVSAVSTPQQTIGTRPIGQANWTEQLGLDYRLPWPRSLSLDCLFGALSNRVASVDNRVRVPAYTYLNLGARYQLSRKHPAGYSLAGDHPLL